MKQVLCFGSINIDVNYAVPHITRPGETLTSSSYRELAGGKGANACVAAAKAGAPITMAGKIGQDGLWVRDLIKNSGVDTSLIEVLDDTPTGRAIIQIDENTGENAIFLYPGANFKLEDSTTDNICSKFNPGDWLVLPNETTAVAAVIRSAHKRGMFVLWNPAPMPSNVADYPIDLVDVLVVNETELEAFGSQVAAQAKYVKWFKDCKVSLDNLDDVAFRVQKALGLDALILTKGSDGALAVLSSDSENPETVSMPIAKIDQKLVTDTTAAGDTWVGYFLTKLVELQSESKDSADKITKDMIEKAMRLANHASAIGVTRKGAIPSIPMRSEVNKFLATGEFPN